MNQTLTARDKKLLHGLLYVVILFIFGWCLIRPLCIKIAQTEEDIEVAQTLESSNKAKVIGLTSAQTLTEKFKVDLSTSTKEYYDYMDSSKIDRLVTSYILARGLRARDLTITMPDEYVHEEPYAYSDIAATMYTVDQADETAIADASLLSDDSDKKKDRNYLSDAVLAFITRKEKETMTVIPTPTEEYSIGTASPASTETAGIYCVGLDIVTEGKPEELQKMIDDLCNKPSVRVTSFIWMPLDPITYLQEDGSLLIVESETCQLSISVNLYMKENERTGE